MMKRQLILLCWLSAFSIFSYADKFKIVGINGAPLRFYDDNQQLVGIDIDIIDTIMKRLNIDYEIEILTSSARLKNLWQDPSVDMILTYSFKESRAQFLYYPQQSHVSLSWNFFILKENVGKFDFNTLNDLKGLRVGATIGFSYTKAFWQAGESGLFELDTVVKNELNMQKLLHYRFDTYANSRVDTLYQARVGGYLDRIAYLEKPLKEKKYYNTFVKASDYPNLKQVMAAYDIELERMRAEGALEAIYRKYLGDIASY